MITNIEPRRYENLQSAYARLFDPNFLLSLNTQLLQTMNQLIQVQKENLNGLNTLSPQKTQRLIEKIQKDPEITRKLNQLNGKKNCIRTAPVTPTSNKSERLFNHSNSEFESSEGSAFKKRKLSSETPAKETFSPDGRSDGSFESNWSDFPKPLKLQFGDEEASIIKKPLEPKKSPTYLTTNTFPHKSAFSVFKLNRQAN